MFDMLVVGCAVVGILLVLIQMAICGFDFDELFFEQEDE